MSDQLFPQTPPAIIAPADMGFARLLHLDKAVDAAEGEGIRARWEFGRELLGRRVFDEQFKRWQLPAGLLDQLVKQTKKSRSEIQYRAQFAERFSTEEAVSNALDTYGSWFEIVNRGLGRLPRDPVETPPLPEGTFATIVADPPWDVPAGAHEWGGSASSQALDYPTMPVEDIAAIPVAEHAAAGAHLYLWTINRYLNDAYDIARAWGFEPSTLLTWCKKPHGLGLGGTYVLTTEFVIFARRGALDALQRVDTSWFTWPRGAHSVKPSDFFDMVETVSPAPRLELFNRGGRQGWAVWGNEVGDAAAS